MLTISKPLSAGQARRYHAEEFQNARENYYTRGDQIRGVWYGQLAERWSLVGEVGEDQFQRLAEGQHPITGEQLVRHQTPRETRNARGETVTTMEHRAGWDATFSAPKSVSITALVAGDEHVREAHRESVHVALNELESYAQARLGGNRRPETTGKAVAALFEHDSARPVNGYAAPQLHTHVVIFNLTETADGTLRPLQPRELYRSQQYATAVYRSELAARLTALGYDIERGRSGQPEIRGYTCEYLEASSPRRRQIENYLAEGDRQGAAAAQIAAHQTREAKVDVSHEEMQRHHQDLAGRFGNQPAHVVEAAEHRRADAVEHVHTQPPAARCAVSFACDRNLEREAVVEERAILRDALQRSLGDARIQDVRQEVDSRVERREFIQIQQEPGTPGRSFTTPAMMELERETIERMLAGQGQYPELVTERTRDAIASEYAHLNESQRRAVQEILTSRDQVTALEGAAGTGKTTALTAVRDATEREGYEIKGFAPTSRAAHKLAEAGIESSTLQRHLVRGDDHVRPTDQKRLYVVDESSLASTRQMHTFLERLRPDDRVLLVGDVRQHEAVDAGRPYHQLQEAGIRTAHVDEIVRQRDPELKAVVEQLSRGETHRAVERLDHQGRVHEIGRREDRLAAIASEYVKDAHATLVVSPDNQSRQDLNDVIHRTMQREGQVDRHEHHVSVLVPRHDITGADRQWAERYEVGDVVRYGRGSKTLGIEAGKYARVESVDAKKNQVTVRTDDERTVAYDPRRLQGVTLYRESKRAFANGDRVQMTAPDRERAVPNRELGRIQRIDTNARLEIRWDSGRMSSFDAGERRHLDYGYAVTSHSSQGQTAGRVLVHVETARAGEKLVNQRFAYVAVSRGQTMRASTPTTRWDSRARWSGTSRIDQRLRERRSTDRDSTSALRSRSANPRITRWPSVRHETTVLDGVKGALRRLRRP
jgi:conjugative relaxase-like TrwC/TraI family protein